MRKTISPHSGSARWVSWLLCVLLIIVALATSVPIAYADNEPEPSVAILEAMLSGSRTWVIDTLVYDDYSTNPQAQHTSGFDDSMMHNALEAYENADNTAYGELYKGFVDVMYLATEGVDAFKQSFFDTATGLWSDIVLSTFGSSENFEQAVDDVAGSVDELQYESVLKAALTADYESSFGVSLGESESEYARLKQLKKALKGVSALNKYIAARNKLVAGTDEGTTLEEYTAEFVLPYSEAVTKHLDSFCEFSEDPESYLIESGANVIGILAAIAKLEQLSISYEFGTGLSEELARDFAEDGVIDLIKGAGKTLDFGSTAISNYIYLNNIQAQKKTITGPLRRIAAETDDSDLAMVMTRFADLAAAEADEKTVAYEAMRDYLRTNNVGYKLASKVVENLLDLILHLGEDFFLTKAITRIEAIVDITAWCIELATGLKSAAKLTYQLLYLNEIIEKARNQYWCDVAEYSANKNEENACMVLDDLLFMQKLRLRGETISYNMGAKQLSSALGLALGWPNDPDIWKKYYDTHIDALIAASITATTSSVFTVGNGETLSLTYYPETGWYGSLQKVGAGFVYVSEIDAKLLYGLRLNGGTLSIANLSDKRLNFTSITTTGTSSIHCAQSDLYACEIIQESGSLTINMQNDYALHVENMLKTTNCSIATNRPVYAKDASFSGPFELSSICLVTGTDGTISGHDLVVSDTLSLSGAWTIDDGSNVNAGEIAVSGTLSLENDARIIADSMTVSNSLNLADSAVQLDNWLSVSGELTTDEQSSINITNDCVLNTVNSAGTVTVGGDLTVVSGSFQNILALTGPMTHSVSGAFSVGKLRFFDSGGTNVNGTITITEELSDSAGKVTNGKGIVLSDPAVLADGSWGWDLSINDLENTLPYTINGTVYTSGGTITNSTLIVGSLVSSGALTLQGSTITASDSCVSSGGLILQQGSTITADNSFSASGAVTVNSSALNSNNTISISGVLTADAFGVVTVLNDCTLSSAANIAGAITVGGDMQSAGGNFGNLTLNGNLPQSIGGSTMNVNNLSISNSSRGGVVLNCMIVVSGQYVNSGTRIGGSGKINTDITLSGAALTEDTVVDCNLKIKNGITLSGCTLTVYGNLTATGDIVLLENSELIVLGDASLSSGTLSGGAIEIPSNAFLSSVTINCDSLAFDRDALLSSCTINCDSLAFGRDALFSSCTITDMNELSIAGDLSISSGTMNRIGTLIICGKTVQSISGADVSAENVVIDNTSRDGVILSANIRYTGSLTIGDTHLINDSRLISEQ